MDNLSPTQRSALMGRVGSKDTAPELVVRRLLRQIGCRYRLHVQSLPGRPDIVVSRLRKVVFVHGCFWHGHPKCKRSQAPKTNTLFWTHKVEGNRRRDARVQRHLRAMGWSVAVVWECQVRNIAHLTARLKRFLDTP
jgi:DNA mismatch endonuclease (patch repair protein)